jgi:hypothetical protein
MLFYGFTILGLLMIVVSLQSFETVAAWLNRFSGDGQFELFTRSRFQMIRILLGGIGLFLTLHAGFAIARWDKTQKYLNSFFTQIKDFVRSFGQDAQTFMQGARDMFFRLPRLDALLLSGSIIAAIIIRLYQVYAPLIADEAYTYNAFASGSLWQTISDYHLPNNHVLLSIMVNVLTHLFGNHVWLIRLPTMIAGVLMVPAGYILARRLYRRNAALLSAALIAVTPILVMYSVWARGYGIVSLFALLLMILADYVRKNKNRFVWFLLVILSAAGFFTIPIMLFPFGAVFLWLFLSGITNDVQSYSSRSDFIRYWLVSGFASALLTVFLYAPILLIDSDRFFHNQFVTPVGWDLFPSILLSSAQETWGQWTGSVPGWGILFGVFGFAFGLFFHKRISRQRVPWQIAFLIWIPVVLVFRRPDMGARLWLFLLAPVLIWSAAGVVGALELLSGVLRKNFYVGEIVASLAVTSVFLFSLSIIPAIPTHWSEKGDIEKTVIYLKDHLQEGDLVNASTNSLSVIRYYFNIYNVPLNYVRRSGPFERAFLAVSRETDTLESLSPVDGSNHPLINLETARIILEFDGLTLYECYPAS